MKLHKFDDFRFEAGPNAGKITGTFWTNIILKIPQAADIVEAPQAKMLNIPGNKTEGFIALS